MTVGFLSRSSPSARVTGFVGLSGFVGNGGQRAPSVVHPGTVPFPWNIRGPKRWSQSSTTWTTSSSS